MFRGGVLGADETVTGRIRGERRKLLSSLINEGGDSLGLFSRADSIMGASPDGSAVEVEVEVPDMGLTLCPAGWWWWWRVRREALVIVGDFAPRAIFSGGGEFSGVTFGERLAESL
jgi:hypothetical protein